VIIPKPFFRGEELDSGNAFDYPDFQTALSKFLN
jgi:hypothetical protein